MKANNIKNILRGGGEVLKIYKGSTEIWRNMKNNIKIKEEMLEVGQWWSLPGDFEGWLRLRKEYEFPAYTSYRVAVGNIGGTELIFIANENGTPRTDLLSIVRSGETKTLRFDLPFRLYFQHDIANLPPRLGNIEIERL